jgi:hypothetical protein
VNTRLWFLLGLLSCLAVVACRLKAAKRRARELAQSLNGCKLRLDEARQQQEAAKQARLAEGQPEAQEVRGRGTDAQALLLMLDPMQPCAAARFVTYQLISTVVCTWKMYPVALNKLLCRGSPPSAGAES